MKLLSALMILILPLLGWGVTRTVALDGTQQFTTIQAAINASNTNDIVLVYPGRYIENVDFNGHSVTVSSLYSVNPLQTYIDSTIVDGNLDTCFFADSGETITVNGFTIVNNEQQVSQNIYSHGGGFKLLNNTHTTVVNCVIRDCIASMGGGFGISYSTLDISNTKIYSNRALCQGGGLYIGYSAVVNFDPTNLCSAYDNTAAMGMDIFVAGYAGNLNIALDMGSKALSGVDNFFISVYGSTPGISINQGYFGTIDNDIYVSPAGDDTNDGLSWVTPLKSVALALQLINSDAQNRHTVNLAAGVYSYSGNGQRFPLSLKSHTIIRGSGVNQTILDGELVNAFFGARYAENVDVTDMKLRNCRCNSMQPVAAHYSEGLRFANLDFVNCMSAVHSGIKLDMCNNIVIENVRIYGTTYDDAQMSLGINYSDNVYINNVVSSNNTITDPESNHLGFHFAESDIVMRNCIIANNVADDAWLFLYQTLEPEFQDYGLDVSNLLIANNTISAPSWVSSPVYITNAFRRMQINNCTLGLNNGSGTMTRIRGYADIRNSIFYNPGYPHELGLNTHVYVTSTNSYIDGDLDMSNCLTRQNIIPNDNQSLVTFTDIIYGGNPLFLGQTTDTLVVRDPDYFRLSSASPCVDTGVADTTGLNLPFTDLAGNPRIYNDRIDMGCFEYTPETGTDDNADTTLSDRMAVSLYPNPVCLSGSKGAYTFIEFTLSEPPKEQPVIEIFNVKGQRVKTIQLSQSYSGLVRKAGLSGQVKQNGEFYSTVWDCKTEQNRKITSGLYLVKVSAGKQQAVAKMMVIR